MKPLLFIIFILLVRLVSSAQVHMTVVPGHMKSDTVKATVRPWVNTGVFHPGELTDFDYDKFLKQRDSLALVNKIDGFKKRLISIDSSIANNKNSRLEDPMLGFMVSYLESGPIDSFAISLRDDGEFNESENFEILVQELNLSFIRFTLDHARYVDRRVSTTSPMQFDARRTFSDLQNQATFNSGQSYKDILLDYIHGLLKNNKDKLGISSETIYEDSIEPADLNVKEKIAMREKFITYVYSKL